MNTQLDTFDDLEKELNKNYSISTPIEDEMDEAACDLEEKISEDSIKSINEDVSNDDLDEIKSFFANND